MAEIFVSWKVHPASTWRGFGYKSLLITVTQGRKSGFIYFHFTDSNFCMKHVRLFELISLSWCFQFIVGCSSNSPGQGIWSEMEQMPQMARFALSQGGAEATPCSRSTKQCGITQDKALPLPGAGKVQPLVLSQSSSATWGMPMRWGWICNLPTPGCSTSPWPCQQLGNVF